MTLEEMQKMIELARNSGVLEFEHRDATGRMLKFTLPAAKHSPHQTSIKSGEILSDPNLRPMMEEDLKKMIPEMPEYLSDLTEEEIKFYATPRFDDLQAEKKARKEKKDLES